MHTFSSLVSTHEKVFEGFKIPQRFISFGEINWDFNMDNVNTNLLIIKNSVVAELYKKVVNNYEFGEGFAVITKIEGENFTMVMTLTNDYNNCLHHYVNLHNEDVIQLLDDSTSTNDCLRAFEYLSELKDGMSESDYKEIHSLLESQLSKKGVDYINQFAPELL